MMKLLPASGKALHGQAGLTIHVAEACQWKIVSVTDQWQYTWSNANCLE